MRSEAFRRHQAASHMWRRLKEDRNQHYDDLTCPCWSNPKFMSRFREQPKTCSGPCCGNPRRFEKGLARLTMQERRHLEKFMSEVRSLTDIVLYYEENPQGEPDYRWCGYVAPEHNPALVYSTAYKASKEELQLWFEGWLAGWRARVYRDEP